jgi:hypothetical protein
MREINIMFFNSLSHFENRCLVTSRVASSKLHPRFWHSCFRSKYRDYSLIRKYYELGNP